MWLNVKGNFQVDEEEEEGCIYFRKSVSKKKEEGEEEYGFVRSRFGRWSFAGGPR